MSESGHVHCHVWAIRIYHHHLKKWHFSFNWSSNPVTFHNFPPWPSKNLSKYWDKSFANRLYTWLTVRQFIELLSHESYKLLWTIMNHHPIHYSIAVQRGQFNMAIAVSGEGDTLFYQSHCMLTLPSNKWGPKQPCQHEQKGPLRCCGTKSSAFLKNATLVALSKPVQTPKRKNDAQIQSFPIFFK